jgi:adenosylmethionine-8-amino-7-oxononanoate aminotransferase
MAGFELVKDRQTKEPFRAAEHISYALEKETLQRGLVVYPCSGTVDGVMGDMILLAPPLTITPGQVEDLLAILDAALDALEKRYLPG